MTLRQLAEIEAAPLESDKALDCLGEVYQALYGLGFEENESLQAINRALRAGAPDSNFDTLLRDSLKELKQPDRRLPA